MRKVVHLVLTFALALCSMAAVAQNGFNYQAVIRNSQGDLVAEQQITLRISLASGANTLYQERQTATTNAYGVVSVVVGTGTPLSGSFTSIDWSQGNISMKTEFDPNGGSNFVTIGTTQLQSVPVAEYAKKTSKVENPKDIQIQATSTTGDDEALFSVKDEEGNVVFAVYKSGVRVYVDDTDTGGKAKKSGFAVAGRAAKGEEGNTYFAVNNEGTQVYVDDEGDGDKAPKSKFAVASVKKSSKEGDSFVIDNYLVVNKEGTKVFVDGNEGDGDKAPKSKFAVASVKKSTKDGESTNDNLFIINDEGTKVFVDSDSGDGDKAPKSKFAVASVKKSSKDGESVSDNYLVINDEGTKVFVDGEDGSGKAPKSKFAVASVRSGRNSKDDIVADDFFLINNEGTKVFIDETTSGKAPKSKFAVASVKKGKDGEKADGINPNYLVIDSDSTRVYIDNANSKAKKSGFAVAGKSVNKGSNADMLKVTQDSTRVYVEGGSSKSGFGVEGKGDGNGKNGFAVTEKSANGNAGYMDVTAKNFFAGYNAGKNTISIYSDATGKYNTFVGNNAGINNDYGSANVFMGYQAGYSLKGLSADENVYIGNRAGKNATSGQWSVVMGNDAGLYAGTIKNSVIIGDRAGWGSNGTDYDRRSTFNSSVMIGSQAGWNYIKSSSNVFIGTNVLNTVNELSRNVALGNSISVGGSDNTILGNGSAAIGTGNIIVGNGVGNGYTDNNSIIIKTNSDDASADNYKNVSIGYEVRAQGTSNIAIGESAGGYSGSSNVYIGKNAGNANYGSNNINIGTGAGKGVNASNKLIISSLSNSDGVIAGTSTNALVYGEFNNTTYKQKLHVNGTGEFTVSRTSSVNTTENGTTLYAMKLLNDTYTNDVAQYGLYSEAKGERANYGYHYGVYGVTTGKGMVSYGVYGYASSTASTNYGVYGKAANATNNWAGYFDGKVNVTGALTAGSLSLGSGSLSAGSLSLSGDLSVSGKVTSSLIPYTGNEKLGSSDMSWRSAYVGDLYVDNYVCTSLIPSANTSYNLGNSTYAWNNLYVGVLRPASGNNCIYAYTNLYPYSNNSYNLGSTTYRWNYVYATNLDVTDVVATNLNVTYVKCNLTPQSGDMVNIGSSANPFSFGYINSIRVGSSIRPTTDGEVTCGSSGSRWKAVYSVGGVSTSSDKRLKTNIKNIENALNKVMSLNGVTYNWRVDEFPDKHFDNDRHAGVLAQELEEVLPEAVDTGEDGYKGVTYGAITPLLIEAVKELKAEKDALETTVAAQQKENEEMKAKLDKLEKLVEELLKK